MSLITLGPLGTFSYDLGSTLDKDVILEPTIGRVFRRVVETGLPGLVPLENSEAGGVVATMDGLMEHPVYITGELYLPIHHCFASDVSLESVTVIFAHPQSHEQCSRFIDASGIPVIHTESNATSAEEQRKRQDSAAIVSQTLATRYEIPVIAQNIENNKDNITRFILIAKEPIYTGSPHKCSLIIDPGENRSGLLYDLLSPFKDAGVNLTRIESRPSKRSMGSYVFFIDFQCEGDWRDAMDTIAQLTRIKPLGCYSLLGDTLCR